MNIAVIPARGGSKRIPRKNIRKFAGKPMIAYSIEAARRSDVFDRIIVSTDDREIADIAKKLGAEVPFIRPADLSCDYTGTIEVIAHAVDWLLSDRVINGLTVCCIYPTAPFICKHDLVEASTKFHSGQWQYVFSGTTYASPIFRSFFMNQRGGLEMFFPEHFEARSQDLPAALHDAGQFYWGNADAWQRRKPIFDEHSCVIEIPRWRVQDIDTEDDWRRAELMLSYMDPVNPAFPEN